MTIVTKAKVSIHIILTRELLTSLLKLIQMDLKRKVWIICTLNTGVPLIMMSQLRHSITTRPYQPILVPLVGINIFGGIFWVKNEHKCVA